MLDKLGKFLAHLLTTVMTLFVVSAATAIVLLARGPLSLSTAKPYVEAALNDEKSPVHIAFKDTLLAWDPKRRRLEVRVLELRIASAEGRVIATAPAMTVDLDPFALLQGRIEPERVVLLAPRVRLARTLEGGIELGLGGGDEAESEGSGDLIAAWLEGDLPQVARSLSSIRVVDAELIIDDRVTGRRWRASRSTLSLTRGDVGTSIEVAARIEIEGRPADLNLNALYRDPVRPIALSLAFTGITPGFLTRELASTTLAPLAAVRVPLAGRVTSTLTTDLTLIELAFEVNGTDGVLALPERFPEALAIEKLHVRGKLENLGQRVVVEAVDVVFAEGPDVHFKGTLRRESKGLGIEGRVDIANLDLTQLGRFWPLGLADNARAWVTERIVGGRVDKARVRLDIRPGELAEAPSRPGMAVLEFEAHKVTTDLWRGLPPLEAARGTGRIDAGGLVATLESGRIGEIALSEGEMKIELGRRKDHVAELSFRAEGEARSVLALLAPPPIGLGRRFGVEEMGAEGRVDARVELKVPLEKKLEIEDIGYTVSARVDELSLPGAFGDLSLSKGALDLVVREDGIDAKGEVALNGVPVSVNWRRDFTGGGAFPSRWGLAAVLDDKARQALGIDLDDYLTGPVSVELQLSRHLSGRYEGRAVLNLKESAIRLDALHWSKSEGRPAEAHFSFSLADGGRREIKEFRLESEDTLFVGSGTASAEGKRITVRRASYLGNDLTAEITIDAEGATELSVAGRVFDLRPMLDDLHAVEDTTSLSVTADLAKLVMSDDHVLYDVKARARRRGGRWVEIALAGRLNGTAPIELEITPAGETHSKLSLSSNDAGAVLAASGFVTSVIGGRLKVEGRMPNEAPSAGLMLEGNVRIDDFILAQVSVLGQALAADSVEEIRKLVKDKGILFHRFVAPFQMTPSRIVLPEGQATGPSLGLTISGYVDRDRDLIDFKGALVPAYIVNTALGEIPVLGELLVGRKGEGLFAMSYRVRGTAASPSIRMNPLTALAPGFLRRLVEALGAPDDGGAGGVPDYPVGNEN